MDGDASESASLLLVLSAILDFSVLGETTDSQRMSRLLQHDPLEGRVKESLLANRKQSYGHPPVPTTLPTAGLAVEQSGKRNAMCTSEMTHPGGTGAPRGEQNPPVSLISTDPEADASLPCPAAVHRNSTQGHGTRAERSLERRKDLPSLSEPDN